MADVNFLRFSFFANTSLGYYKSGHVGEGLAAAFYSHLFRESTENTLQLGHRGPKRRKNGSFFRRTCWSPGCEELLVAGWLASGHHTCTCVPRTCLIIMHRRSITSHHLLACIGAGSEAECHEALTCLPAIGLYARP